MSDKVKIIIEIPKYYLEHPQDYTCLAECVRRGTILPKGHGRLGDLDFLAKMYQCNECDQHDDSCPYYDETEETWDFEKCYEEGEE